SDLVEIGMEAGIYGDDGSAQGLESDLWPDVSADAEHPGYLRRGGRIFAIHPRRTSKGNIVSTFEDVTDRAKAESALRASEGRLSAILESMPDCVQIFDQG